MVFNLSVIDEFNDEDISSKLQISIDAVQFNLQNARDELCKLLEPMEVIRSA